MRFTDKTNWKLVNSNELNVFTEKPTKQKDLRCVMWMWILRRCESRRLPLLWGIEVKCTFVSEFKLQLQVDSEAPHDSGNFDLSSCRVYYYWILNIEYLFSLKNEPCVGRAALAWPSERLRKPKLGRRARHLSITGRRLPAQISYRNPYHIIDQHSSLWWKFDYCLAEQACDPKKKVPWIIY